MFKFFKSMSNFKVKITRLRHKVKKLWYHVKGLVIENNHVPYESPVISDLKVMVKLKFFKSRPNFKVKVTRFKLCHHVKGLVTRNAHVFFCFESSGQGLGSSNVGNVTRAFTWYRNFFTL